MSLVLDMSSVVQCFSCPVTLYRTDPGFVNTSTGRFEPGECVESTIQAHVQPMSGKDQALLPENTDIRNAVAIYTTEELRGIDPDNRRPADQFDWKGDRYEVQTVFQWLETGKYRKCVGLKMEAYN